MTTDAQTDKITTPADSAPRGLCLPGWAWVSNIIGLGGVLLILVGEMLETERWRPLMAACLFILLLLIQFVAFWLAGRVRTTVEPVPREQ